MRLLSLNYGKYIGELVVTIDLAPTTIFTFHLVNLPETLVFAFDCKPGGPWYHYPWLSQAHPATPSESKWDQLGLSENLPKPSGLPFFSFDNAMFFLIFGGHPFGTGPTFQLVFLMSSTLWMSCNPGWRGNLCQITMASSRSERRRGCQ